MTDEEATEPSGALEDEALFMTLLGEEAMVLDDLHLCMSTSMKEAETKKGSKSSKKSKGSNGGSHIVVSVGGPAPGPVKKVEIIADEATEPASILEDVATPEPTPEYESKPEPTVSFSSQSMDKMVTSANSTFLLHILTEGDDC